MNTGTEVVHKDNILYAFPLSIYFTSVSAILILLHRYSLFLE